MVRTIPISIYGKSFQLVVDCQPTYGGQWEARSADPPMLAHGQTAKGAAGKLLGAVLRNLAEMFEQASEDAAAGAHFDSWRGEKPS